MPDTMTLMRRICWSQLLCLGFLSLLSLCWFVPLEAQVKKVPGRERRCLELTAHSNRCDAILKPSTGISAGSKELRSCIVGLTDKRREVLVQKTSCSAVLERVSQQMAEAQGDLVRQDQFLDSESMNGEQALQALGLELVNRLRSTNRMPAAASGPKK